MYRINPYRPGAGLMPIYLAGRDDDIELVNEMFDAIKVNVPVQSVIFCGLRGVGKTVLINRLRNDAEDKKIFCRHIEIEERNDFISQIAECAQAFLREVSVKAKLNDLIQKSIDAIKSLVISFDPSNNTFSLSIQDAELYKSVSLVQSLTDVFTSIGKTAYKLNMPICFFIDEMQNIKSEELSALITALHRSNQLGYPVMLVGAGLPKLYKMLSEEKSYSERLFVYREIDSLNEEQCINAIQIPAKMFNVKYSDGAVKRIISITKGYPFFIQQLCAIVYGHFTGIEITENNVESCVKEFYNTIDVGFFKVRYERCSEADKKFIFAMVMCGKLPCTIADIARNLHKTVNQVSPIRAQLISKGIIYSVRYKELDFTVPEFDGFVKRLDEYKEWICEVAMVE